MNVHALTKTKLVNDTNLVHDQDELATVLLADNRNNAENTIFPDANATILSSIGNLCTCVFGVGLVGNSILHFYIFIFKEKRSDLLL